MNKKIFLLPLISAFLFACASLQENYNMVNCKYDIVKAEPADFNIDSLTMDVAISVNNLSKTAAAALKRFDGDLYINDTNVSNIVFKDIRVEPGENKVIKSQLVIPFKNLGKTLTGLVSMGSVSVDYKVKGTMYFTTPIGEVPYQVTIYQSKKF